MFRVTCFRFSFTVAVSFSFACRLALPRAVVLLAACRRHVSLPLTAAEMEGDCDCRGERSQVGNRMSIFSQMTGSLTLLLAPVRLCVKCKRRVQTSASAKTPRSAYFAGSTCDRSEDSVNLATPQRIAVYPLSFSWKCDRRGF